jgi:hypothetical protein
MFRTGFLSIIRSLASNVCSAISICHTDYADLLLASSQHNVYDIYLLLCLQCWTPDDGQRKCPKYVEFLSKNVFEKLVHLVGFIIRIYHVARSSECQILFRRVCVPREYHCPVNCSVSYTSPSANQNRKWHRYCESSCSTSAYSVLSASSKVFCIVL